MDELGYPYMWVQNLGGLHFPSETSEVSADIMGCVGGAKLQLVKASFCLFPGRIGGQFP